MKFYGTENIPLEETSGLIVAANHQTYFDPFWLCIKVDRDFRYMAWDKACDWVVVGKIIRWLGAFPVSLEGGGKESYRKSLYFLREGKSLTIFPEASREFSDGKMLTFKSGAVRIALETGVPILPVTIRGANKVWSQDHKIPHVGRVEIYFHPVLHLPKLENKNDLRAVAEEWTEKLKEIIASKL